MVYQIAIMPSEVVQRVTSLRKRLQVRAERMKRKETSLPKRRNAFEQAIASMKGLEGEHSTIVIDD